MFLFSFWFAVLHEIIKITEMNKQMVNFFSLLKYLSHFQNSSRKNTDYLKYYTSEILNRKCLSKKRATYINKLLFLPFELSY